MVLTAECGELTGVAGDVGVAKRALDFVGALNGVDQAGSKLREKRRHAAANLAVQLRCALSLRDPAQPPAQLAG